MTLLQTIAEMCTRLASAVLAAVPAEQEIGRGGTPPGRVVNGNSRSGVDSWWRHLAVHAADTTV